MATQTRSNLPLNRAAMTMPMAMLTEDPRHARASVCATQWDALAHAQLIQHAIANATMTQLSCCCQLVVGRQGADWRHSESRSDT
jgi:hypothetical protein